MVKTAARAHSVDKYAKVFVQHHSVVHMKERLLTSKDTSSPGKPWKRFDQPRDRYPKFSYLGYGNDPEYQEPDQPQGEHDEGYGYEGYPATVPGSDQDEWIDDEDLAIQLNVYTAVAFEAELDDLDDSFAESVQLDSQLDAAQTAFAQAKGKSKGKGKPGGKSGGKVVRSNLASADRKAKLAEIKAKSRCLKCGIVGHWAGDAVCM